MKKHFLFALLLLVSSISFGNWSVSPWEEVLHKQKLLPPTVAVLQLWVTHQVDIDNLTIDLMFEQPGTSDGHTWRVTIPTQVYKKVIIPGRPITWQWVTILYTVDVDPYSIHKIVNYPLYNDGQLLTKYNGLGGEGTVDDSQYYVSSIVQL
jgi:hypothetical protein